MAAFTCSLSAEEPCLLAWKACNIDMNVHRQDFNRRLREEQDLAYQQSLAEDQERERQRTAKREQQAAAERVAAEAAAKSKCATAFKFCTTCRLGGRSSLDNSQHLPFEALHPAIWLHQRVSV